MKPLMILILLISSGFSTKERSVATDFVNRFLPIAIEEMETYGIPASIKLGQGIIESGFGTSTLAKESNNYFGIKCKTKCLGCTCRNYKDDSKYDMFRVFEYPEDSWREHSKVLLAARYRFLFKIPKQNYKLWAVGLKKYGYATDPAYAKKLIQVIEKYKLYRFD